MGRGLCAGCWCFGALCGPLWAQSAASLVAQALGQLGRGYRQRASGAPCRSMDRAWVRSPREPASCAGAASLSHRSRQPARRERPPEPAGFASGRAEPDSGWRSLVAVLSITPEPCCLLSPALAGRPVTCALPWCGPPRPNMSSCCRKRAGDVASERSPAALRRGGDCQQTLARTGEVAYRPSGRCVGWRAASPV